LLEQVLAPDQYAKNVATKDGGERVEFAVKLPGPGNDKDEVLWLRSMQNIRWRIISGLLSTRKSGCYIGDEAANNWKQNQAGCGKYPEQVSQSTANHGFSILFSY